jgi:UDP-2,3-diacylglucosamine pyrophosphatase LpxH
MAPPETAAHRSPDKYQRRIARGLDRAFSRDDIEIEQIELDGGRLVIFSDHHKGVRDGADDFLRCERAYNAALGYYLELGYRLIVLGDAEELWENDPEPVIAAYSDTLELEAAFMRLGRYQRVWGNHDDLWRYQAQVTKHLDDYPDLEVREALKLQLTSDGEPLGLLFLVHGHQGTTGSDRFSWLSRLVVRYLWRPLQRRLKIPSTTPAREWRLRQRHEAAMFGWASEQWPGLVLIAGHTHRPIFTDTSPNPKLTRPPDLARRDLDQARAAPAPDSMTVARLRAEVEFNAAEARRMQSPPIQMPTPCYFNTGCCSFGDGDVTGLEIADGEIRLVRWPLEDEQPLPKLLARVDLRAVLAAVKAGP